MHMYKSRTAGFGANDVRQFGKLIKLYATYAQCTLAEQWSKTLLESLTWAHSRHLLTSWDDRAQGLCIVMNKYQRCRHTTPSQYLYKKLSCRWQTARRLCTPIWAAFRWMTAIYWPNFPTFTYPSPIWRPQWKGCPRAIGFIFGTTKTRMAGLQSGEARMMIESVVWAQYINVTYR